MRPCPQPFSSCGQGCPPCVGSPCGTVPCGCPPMGCSTLGALFAQATPNASLPGGTATQSIVPGLLTIPFSSVSPEQLAIDATAFVDLEGSEGPFEVTFEVFVDASPVPGGQFGVFVPLQTPMPTPWRTSVGTTLLVTVPAGAHVVSVRWSSPNGSPGSIAGILDSNANLRVLRLACA